MMKRLKCSYFLKKNCSISVVTNGNKKSAN